MKKINKILKEYISVKFSILIGDKFQKTFKKYANCSIKQTDLIMNLISTDKLIYDFQKRKKIEYYFVETTIASYL